MKAVYYRDYNEDQHPRDDHGRWSSDGGGSASSDSASSSSPPLRVLHGFEQPSLMVHEARPSDLESIRESGLRPGPDHGDYRPSGIYVMPTSEAVESADFPLIGIHKAELSLAPDPMFPTMYSYHDGGAIPPERLLLWNPSDEEWVPLLATSKSTVQYRDADFDPDKHPRDDSGKFSSTGGGGDQPSETPWPGLHEWSDAKDAARQKIEDDIQKLLPRGGMASVTRTAQAVQAGETTRDVLTEMKDRGYKMPNQVEIVSVLDDHVTGLTTEEKHLRIYIPDALPPEANLDRVIAAYYQNHGPEGYAVTNTRDLVVHEMGHVLSSKLEPGSFGSEANRATARTVSHYASSNANEFIAESFVRLYRGEYLTRRPEGEAMSLPWPNLTTEEWRELLRAQKRAAGVSLLRDFDEAQHPRDESGKWTSGDGGGGASKPEPVSPAAAAPDSADVKDNPKFRAWFADSKVVDENGDPQVVYHGTAGDFSAFSTERANPEADLGAGLYFTNTPDDVSTNYAGEGPDLTGRIEYLAETIAQDLSDEHPDWSAEEVNDAASEQARDQLAVANEGFAMPVYLKIETPVVIGGGPEKESFLDWNSGMDEDGEFTGEDTGKAVEFYNALHSVASQYSDGDIDALASRITEEALDGGISASKIYEFASEDEQFGYFTDDLGRLVSKEILRESFERIGYDGIIDYTANDKFGTARPFGKPMAGMDENTVHYVAFKPTQIKSAIGNSGEFDPNSADITKDFDESQHPRDQGGRFSETSEGGGEAKPPLLASDGTPFLKPVEPKPPGPKPTLKKPYPELPPGFTDISFEKRAGRLAAYRATPEGEASYQRAQANLEGVLQEWSTVHDNVQLDVVYPQSGAYYSAPTKDGYLPEGDPDLPGKISVDVRFAELASPHRLESVLRHEISHERLHKALGNEETQLMLTKYVNEHPSLVDEGKAISGYARQHWELAERMYRLNGEDVRGTMFQPVKATALNESLAEWHRTNKPSPLYEGMEQIVSATVGAFKAMSMANDWFKPNDTFSDWPVVVFVDDDMNPTSEASASWAYVLDSDGSIAVEVAHAHVAEKMALMLREFDESQHPRDEDGKFASGGGGGGGAAGATGGASMQSMFERIGQPDSGFTYQPRTGIEPKGGFAVSIYPERSFGVDSEKFTFEDFARYAKDNADLFEKEDHFMGGWHDPASHRVFLDVSVVKSDPREAEALCLAHDQIAYFDLGGGKSVTVNSQATSGGAAKSHVEAREAKVGSVQSRPEDADDRSARADVRADDGQEADGAGTRSRSQDPRAVVRLLPLSKFDESQHPRDEGGKFTDAGGGGDPRVAGETSTEPGGTGSSNQIGSTVLKPVAASAVAEAEARLSEEGFPPELMRENIDHAMRYALDHPEIWDEGIHWYEREHELAEQLAAKYPPMTGDQAAAILAAVSPRIDVDHARDAAGRVAAAVEADSRIKVTNELIEDRYQRMLTFADSKPASEREILREKAAESRARWTKEALGKSYDVLTGDAKQVATWHSGRMPAMTDGWSKGLIIARGDGTPDEVLSGPKVRSFYDNMRNPTGSDSVTIDGWMVKAVTGEHNASDGQVSKWIGNAEGDHTSGRYEVFSQRVREAAVRYSITPLQVQAIVWTSLRAQPKPPKEPKAPKKPKS